MSGITIPSAQSSQLAPMQVGEFQNDPGQIHVLKMICIEKQTLLSNHVKDFVFVAALVTAIAVGVLLGGVLTAGLGVLIGLAAGYVSHTLFSILADKLKSHRFENALIELNNPHFIQYANQKRIHLTMEHLFETRANYLKENKERVRQS